MSVQSVDLRVMSYNVRTTDAADGPNGWVDRRDLWTAGLRAFAPDMLGLQEVCADQHDDLRERFPDYGFVGVARNDGRRAGECALVLYRPDRFELLEGGTFWLSKTPTVVGSKSWDSKHVRICSWARLRDRSSGAILVHANTHLDDMGSRARVEGARLIQQMLPKLTKGDAAVIVTGDFNSTEIDEPYAALIKPTADGLQLFDSYRTVHPQRADDEATIHGFSDRTRGMRIDWILHSPQLTAVTAAINRHRGDDGRFPSDHHSVTAVLRWQTSPPTSKE